MVTWAPYTPAASSAATRCAENWLTQPPLSSTPSADSRSRRAAGASIQPSRRPGASDLENEPSRTTGAAGSSARSDGGASPS